MRRPAMVMIRQAQPQRRNSGALKHTAQRQLTIPLTVPLRQNNHGEIRAGVKESAPHRVVLRIWSFNRAGELQNGPVEIILFHGFITEKGGAVQKGARNEVPQWR